MPDFTDDHIDAAVSARETEYGLWGARHNLPPRNGMPIDDWMEAQRHATYVVVRGGVDVTGELVDALNEPEFFLRRDRAAMRAAIAALPGLGG